ncbi:hypothetical protein QEH56_01290 [Pelagicoccus enzymogenes]|uniref:hypothetical protein n=1 Tax=Pelagicoccus enzymogenes TaxID=2773457 RepID=UPI00280FEBB3|nr:hypothetical protein [Pelagicoccus enzymogenes]MDQ8196757.1 hypothetical protein [Pelagicoccus enzymogenes]
MKKLPVCLLAASTFLIGCASVKNPGPSAFPSFSEPEVSQTLKLTVHVKKPQREDLDDIIPEETKTWIYNRAVYESERLAMLLRKCQLFEQVLTGEPNERKNGSLTLKALPRLHERTGFDDPMILIYLGVFPLWEKENHGVAFQVLETQDEFQFSWQEERVIGMVAPLISATNQNWSSKRANEAYWKELRAELHRFFKAYEKEQE